MNDKQIKILEAISLLLAENAIIVLAYAKLILKL